ncbi:MAG: thiamine pyrophosphate-binding protein, partial [Porticoccaceae bacterium]|nr:thiamine pyrophosphate-binding protein [Porticoccaceae bacterium]
MSTIDADSDRIEKAQAEPEMGDLLVAYLNQLGVEYVFGVPGGAIEPLYNALARSERQGGVRAVVARHETGAAFMADGYARNTGKLGVCCSTTGPGATNMITGVASAYENNVPMLAITAQTAISTFGKGAIQDSSCTGINTVGDAVGSLIQAFQEDMLVYLENLNIAIESNDQSQIRHIAHTIKGSASNFGAYDLVNHSKEL